MKQKTFFSQAADLSVRGVFRSCDVESSVYLLPSSIA